jgi:hypothetical protein
MAEEPDPLLAKKLSLAADFKNATVREISLEDARNLIVAQEWLGSLGSTEHAFGLFFWRAPRGLCLFWQHGWNQGQSIRVRIRARKQGHNPHERLHSGLG